MTEGPSLEDHYEIYEDDERVLENRIKFSKAHLYGREAELASLYDIFKRASCSERGTEAVLIYGYSGTGKSSLVQTLAKEIAEKAQKATKSNDTPCYFLSGKFDELQCADPFSAIVQAFRGLASYLQKHKDAETEEFKRLSRNCSDAVGSDGKVLTNFVPELTCLFSDEKLQNGGIKIGTDKHLNDTVVNKQIQLSPDPGKHFMWNRFSYLFQQFVRAISTEDRPVVLFLDDLQWADIPSLDLMASLIKDSSLKHVMLIGAARSNQIDDSHPLNQNLLNIVEKTRKIHRIDLMNLPLQDINDFVVDSLQVKQEQALPLTTAIYSKTRGNIFFTMQALEELHRNKVIYYSTISFQWEWNLEKVRREGERLADDVVGIVTAKIKGSPELLQRALSVASYTRSTFDLDTLLSLMNAEDGFNSEGGDTLKTRGTPYIDKKHLLRLLDTAVLEGLLFNRFGSKDYTFAHDRIQQAAYSLVTAGHDRDNLRKRIGTNLLKRAHSSVGEDWMLFVAADHLNYISCNGNNNNNMDVYQLAKLNLVVGEKAMFKAAFSTASKYLQNALKLLQSTDSYWQDHYQLTLAVFKAIHDAALALGNNETVSEIGRQVLDNARTTDDALPTYLALSMAKAQEDCHSEALQFCMEALHAQCRFPKQFHFAHAMKVTSVVQRLHKAYSDDQILQLPRMTEKKHLLTACFLVECSCRAYLCNNLFLSLLCSVRNIQLSFKYGLSGYHAFSYGVYGFFMKGNFDKRSIGQRMSKLAKQILDIYDNGDKQIRCMTLCLVGSYFDSWSFPPSEVIETFERAHKAGMESGFLEFAFRGMIYQINFIFLAGYPLGKVEQQSVEATTQLRRYDTIVLLDYLKEMRFLFKHLIGDASVHDSNSNTTSLDWKEIQDYARDIQYENKGEGLTLLQGLLSRLQLAVYFDELSVAENIMETSSKVFQIDSHYHIVVVRLFFFGLTASGLLRQAKKKKYKSLARKMVLEMKKQGGRNSHHKYLLMEADLKSCTFNATSQYTLYDEAISAALKIGSIHDAALGCELGGKYFLSIGGDDNREKATKYFRRACALYGDWGAAAKVQHLKNKYESLLAGSYTITRASTGPGVINPITYGIQEDCGPSNKESKTNPTIDLIESNIESSMKYFKQMSHLKDTGAMKNVRHLKNKCGSFLAEQDAILRSSTSQRVGNPVRQLLIGTKSKSVPGSFNDKRWTDGTDKVGSNKMNYHGHVTRLA